MNESQLETIKEARERIADLLEDPEESLSAKEDKDLTNILKRLQRLENSQAQMNRPHS